jgi:hypothetical protein
VTETLLHCPFCGQPPEMQSDADGSGYWIRCRNAGCRVVVETYGYDLARATERWNRRAGSESETDGGGGNG